jgi:heme/copper-type cytochrome/quinol oxidase subunit 2
VWGNITIEANLQTNFNVGFTNMKSDILIHLTQWQYWWWFWFGLLWSFYYLVIIRIIRFRSLKFRPRLATTFRPHGKWGDLIVCIIPVSWCANIITNSNFILRMIEWQSESGLLTVRIRGKQWYWIYKFELKTFTDILTVPKNVGRNKWQIATPGDLQVAEDYLQILQLRSSNRWANDLWSELSKESYLAKDVHLVSSQEQLRFNFFKNHQNNFNFSESYDTSLLTNNLIDNSFEDIFNENFQENYKLIDGSLDLNLNTRLKNKKLFWENVNMEDNGSKELEEKFDGNYLNFFKNLNNNTNYSNELEASNSLNFWKLLTSDDLFDSRYQQNMSKKNIFSFLSSNVSNDSNFMYNYFDFSEVDRSVRKSQGTNSPIRLIKYPLSNINDFDKNNENVELFRFRFNETDSTYTYRPVRQNTLLIIRQKKYKRRKSILPRAIFFKDQTTGKRLTNQDPKYQEYTFLSQNKIILKNNFNATNRYRMVRKSKNRYELTNLVLSKRLLRTRRTLVLPAHVNLTAITNSYDVVHSWFIPGLGLKLDCVPGRATHHTFYIDNVGFYYGQCAEICGRYHHHMPIRICALPFEHFLVWWQKFGLPKLLFTKNFKRFQYHYGFRKYVW